MKSRDKQLNMLGLAQRANALVSGDELVETALSEGKVYLVICAQDASDNTKGKYQNKCQRNMVPLYQGFSKYEISQAIGKSRTIVALKNQGMAKKFLSYTELEESEAHHD